VSVQVHGEMLRILAWVEGMRVNRRHNSHWNLSLEDIVKMQHQFVRSLDEFLEFFGVANAKEKDRIRDAVIEYSYREIDRLREETGCEPGPSK